mgnify:CR=1 FL=1
MIAERGYAPHGSTIAAPSRPDVERPDDGGYRRVSPVVTLDSAALQGRIAVESGDSAPIAGCSGPVPMVWAPRTARGALMRAVHRRRRAPVEDAPLGRLHQYDTSHSMCENAERK